MIKYLQSMRIYFQRYKAKGEKSIYIQKRQKSFFLPQRE